MKVAQEEASEYNADLTDFWPTQQGSLKQTTPVREVHVGQKWLGPSSPACIVEDFLGRVWLHLRWILKVGPTGGCQLTALLATKGKVLS